MTTTSSLIAATALILAHSYSLSLTDAWQPQSQPNVLHSTTFPSSKQYHNRRRLAAWSPSPASLTTPPPRRFSHRLYGGKWSSSHNTETARTTRTSSDDNDEDAGETNTFFFNPPNWFSSMGTSEDSSSNKDVGASTRGKVLRHDRAAAADDGDSEISSSFFELPNLPSFQQQTNDESIVETNTNDDSSTSIISTDNESAFGAAAILGVVTIIATTASLGDGDVSSVITQIQAAVQDPGAALEAVVDTVDSMGPLGVAYFGIAYTIAEIFAIPAIPLTASAGYLFGPVQGTGIVLFSAAIAAAVSFGIGRTLLRDYVEGILVDFPKFAKIDKAIGKEGFKLMLLLRLSPIFPFALSNYLYGASSINFPAFFWGTVLGFAPGTIAYVYTGYVGKALTDGGTEAYPWYVYGLGLTLFGGLLKIIADVATRIVEEIEEEEG